MIVEAAENDDILDDKIDEENDKKTILEETSKHDKKQSHIFRKQKTKVTWVGTPLKVENGRTYHNAAQLDQETVS